MDEISIKPIPLDGNSTEKDKFSARILSEIWKLQDLMKDVSVVYAKAFCVGEKSDERRFEAVKKQNEEIISQLKDLNRILEKIERKLK